MGKKLDALLGRDFRTSRLKTLAKLTISRIAILRNQHRARFSYARSDVVELLRLGHQQQALLRVEYVIKEQNMLDVFVLIENSCQLLLETVGLLKENKEFPDELKETMSSLIFASSRCGEFPELQEIRGIFSSHFSKDFAARAVELRNNCGVNPKMIQKLSSRQPSLETRQKVLMKIASENGQTLHLVDDIPLIPKDKLHINQDKKQQEHSKLPNLKDPDPIDRTQDMPEELKFAESIRPRKDYRDVATAEEAFESAAYAGEAEQAAVELSRQDSHEKYSDEHSSPNHRQGNKNVSGDRMQRPIHQVDDYKTLKDIKNLRNKFGIENIHPTENFSSESDGEDTAKCGSQTYLEDGNSRASIERTISDSSSDSEGDIIFKRRGSPEPQHQNEPKVYSLVSDGTDDSAPTGHGIIPWTKHHPLDSDAKPAPHTNNYQNFHQHNRYADNGNKLGNLPQKWIPLNTRAGSMAKNMETKRSDFVEQLKPHYTDTDKKHLSVRTRRASWN